MRLVSRIFWFFISYSQISGKITFQNLKRVAKELGESISDEELRVSKTLLIVSAVFSDISILGHDPWSWSRRWRTSQRRRILQNHEKDMFILKTSTVEHISFQRDISPSWYSCHKFQIFANFRASLPKIFAAFVNRCLRRRTLLPLLATSRTIAAKFENKNVF